MKAAYIQKTGPPENIIYGDLPKPEPADTQVLVKIDAADVNPIDTYIRGGLVAMPLPNPYVLGCDLAGVVEAVGPAATQYKVGDRVWGSNQGTLGRQGTLAEYAAVEERWLYPTPHGITSEAVVAMSLVGITAHLGLVRHAKVEAGEIVFVNGGTGGVGSAVVRSPPPAAPGKSNAAANWAPIWPSTTAPRTSTRGSNNSRRKESTCGGKRCASRTSIAR